MWRWRRVAALALGIVGSTAAACQPATTYAGPPFAAVDPSLGAAFLTWEGRDTYSLTAGGDDAGNPTVTTAALSSNQGSNTRVVFWRLADSVGADQQSCVTWSEGGSQPGIALRVRYSGGHTQAITVTQNIVYGVAWAFNVHVMDSSQAPPFRQLGGFDMSGALRSNGRTLPYPWRLCARAVRDTVSFKVWPTSQSEPAWNDARYGASVTLPGHWATSTGRAGWYVGHLDPGVSVRFSDLTVAGIAGITPRPAETTTTTSPTTTTSATTDTTTLPEEPTTRAEDPTDIPSPP